MRRVLHFKGSPRRTEWLQLIVEQSPEDCEEHAEEQSAFDADKLDDQDGQHHRNSTKQLHELVPPESVHAHDGQLRYMYWRKFISRAMRASA